MDTDNEGPTIRESLEAAYDAAEGGAEAGVDTVSPAADAGMAESSAAESGEREASESSEGAEETAEEKAQRARDEAGRFTKEGKQKAQVKPGPRVAAQAGAKPPPAAGTPQGKPTAGAKGAVAGGEGLKAPQSWKATAREAWASIPPAAQAEIDRREREAAQAVKEAAPARQFQQEFQATFQPFQGFLAAEGAGDKPLQVVRNLLQTAAALRTHQKEAVLANLIHTFQADPARIAGFLQGQRPQPQAPAFDPLQLKEQLKKELFGDLSAQRQQQALNRAQAEMSDFAESHEFFEDVRELMAKYMEAGLADDWEEAYSQATQKHPEVSRALKQREEASRANAQRASTQRARAAASSLRSQPAPVQQGEGPKSLRDTIEAAYDSLSGGSR